MSRSALEDDFGQWKGVEFERDREWLEIVEALSEIVEVRFGVSSVGAGEVVEIYFGVEGAFDWLGVAVMEVEDVIDEVCELPFALMEVLTEGNFRISCLSTAGDIEYKWLVCLVAGCLSPSEEELASSSV